MAAPTRTRLLLYGGSGASRQVTQITHWQDVTNTNSLGVGERMPVGLEYHLEDGTRLEYVDQNTFSNPQTGELLYRIPPARLAHPLADRLGSRAARSAQRRSHPNPENGGDLLPALPFLRKL